jgi:hypothetical protein
MTSPPGAYLFLLGLACGSALLALTAYRHLSPAWVKWTLVACALCAIGRHITLALFATADDPQRFWALRRFTLATTVGLTLPTVFALDQLLRHPAVSPRKLLVWSSPWLCGYAIIILFGRFTGALHPATGWLVQPDMAWRWVIAVLQAGFAVALSMVGVKLLQRVPVPRIRLAICGLLLGQLALAFDCVVLAMGAWYAYPLLYSEMLTLAAIWYALDVSRASLLG